MKFTTEKPFLKAFTININGIKSKIDHLTSSMTPVDLTNRSTRGKLSKQYIFKNYKDIKEIIEFIILNLKIIYPKDNFKLKAAWTVYGQKDSYHLFHKHDKTQKNCIATIIYLEVPKKEPGDFGYIINEEAYRISPEKGLFCVMPINLLHGAYPQGKGLRQTLNLDFEVV